MNYCKTTTSETAMNLFDLQLENREDYIIALHPFDWESAMLHHCAASFRLRTSNVTTYSSHCTVSFRPTIGNLQSLLQLLLRATLQWTLFDRRWDGFDTSSPGKGQPPTITTSSDIRWTLFDWRCDEIELSFIFAKLRWSFSIDDSEVEIKHSHHRNYSTTAIWRQSRSTVNEFDKATAWHNEVLALCT